MRCSNCQTTLANGARFCHSCGDKVIGKPSDCPSCGIQNNGDAKFCAHCGCALSANHNFVKEDYVPRYNLKFDEVGSLSEQIGGHFFAGLKKRLAEEHDPKKYKDYVSTFYESNFDKKFNLKASQLAEEVYTIHCKQDDTVLPEIDSLLDKNFDSLLDHFIILHCKHLNDIEIPEIVLKYENTNKTDVNLEEMIFDYLDIKKETNEKFYLDFISIPENKIKNAVQSFLFADKKEMVFLLCDQTVFGSCKEGFALTERGIYWKAHFNKAYAVHYENLQEIKREKEWITINGRYFHVNPSFNLKLLKLLKKLKRIF